MATTYSYSTIVRMAAGKIGPIALEPADRVGNREFRIEKGGIALYGGRSPLHIYANFYRLQDTVDVDQIGVPAAAFSTVVVGP